MRNEWTGFVPGVWEKEIDVRDFIQKNYTPYDGDDAFLAGPTEDTKALWQQVLELSRAEREAGGVLDMDTRVISTITSHAAGYLDKEKETIVGFQTEKPFKRALMPYGGIRMAQKACEDNGYHVDPEVVEFFTTHRKTHNAGVFDAYTPEMRACRSSHIITGLPDAYGRGRIIGDYRRVALYGVDRLIEDKRHQKDTTRVIMYSDVIREREELSEQIRALDDLKKLGEIYGFDISRPAKDTREAIQWLYFGYLAAVKEQNGAAMSLGRTSTFLDVYAQRDLAAGVYTEWQIQEFVDHFIMKLRLIKFARTPEYNDLFSGDPQWVTESIGGVGIDGRHMVTKMSYRYLHTLQNLGTAPEPNLTVQDFTANVSHELKTPLTAISGYAELIENHMVDPEQETRFALEIQQNATRLLSLINDIIRLSELDSGEDNLLCFEQVDLDEVAGTCVKNLQMNAQKRNVTLYYEGVSCMLRADRGMISELVDNLCQNAIRYNNEGGEVHVRVYYEKGQPMLSVADNGIGIPKDQQERIFERFYRVDKSRSKQTGGTGLGLAIVKHIVELHDATLKLESEPGKGTTITVAF